MADLKRVFEALEFSEVRTYIQSGNVLFKSNEAEEILRLKIERKIDEVFGFPVVVVLRNAKELEQSINNCPFSEKEVSEAEASSNAESLYVSLLANIPSHENIGRLKAYKSESDDYRVKGREVFLLFHNSIRNSKLADNLHKLDVSSTVRNWKTINKIVMIAKSMEV